MLKSFADGRIFGARTGTGSPRVIALHGWRRTHADFAELLEGMDAIAVDLPGFGSSPEPPVAWGAGEYADALAAVAETFDTPPVILGHSFGGRVAVCLAAARPELAKALVLSGVPLLRRAGAPRKAKMSIRIARQLHKLGLVSGARMEELRRRHGSADYRAATGVMRDTFVRLVNETYEDEMRALQCPVELVWGDDDTEAPLELAQRSLSIIPKANLVVVPGAGHLTPRSATAELRAAIERHLS